MVREDFPKPPPTGDGVPFWAYAREHELRVQRCRDCGLHRFHPRPRCPRCRSEAADWVPCRGTGSVFSYTICYPPVLPAYASSVPYNVAVIELDEGPLMVSNVVDCPNEELEVGLPVEVCFVDVDEELTLPQFRPRR
ncbi:MAG TPA: OB-fold domain-containing protein [Acidimicrobiales bacterium]|nr:OB-fold domain-containing protein [Acidimicrobiales bacterium]